ncbi:MAG: sensor histidine kinase [Mucilaginibacter sp.]
MKLAYHYNKASIIIAMSVLFIGGFIYYFSIRYIATDQLDRDLTEEIDEVKYYVNLHNKLPKQVDFDEDQTTFTKIRSKTIPRRFFDTLYYNDKEKQLESGRAVEGTVAFKNDNYKVVISESKEATEYLVQVIVLITILLAIILLAVLIITNRLILNGLWKPFYKTLHQLKTFDISDNSQLIIKQGKVDEFEELNTALLLMTTKAKSDFQHVKSFTEHASHEMMTPLAVVTSKLDTLIQDEALNADQLTQITNIYAYINKLSRLNQSLLLLVKIDNKLIKDVEPINLKDTIQDKITQFQELIQGKILLLNNHLGNKHINASKYLIDILLNNLFSNAVRHNKTGGEIEIILTDKELIIKNTGGDTPLEDDLIFERFHRGNHSEGTGMGLTLVRNICSYYNYKIKYTYETGWHVFTIVF